MLRHKRTNQFLLKVTLLGLLGAGAWGLAACEPPPVPPPANNNGDENNGENNGDVVDMGAPDEGMPDGGNNGTPDMEDTGVDMEPDEGTPDFEDVGPGDCSDVEFRGQRYNCTALDLCTEDDFQYRLACCDCDPAYCNAPPPGECGPVCGDGYCDTAGGETAQNCAADCGDDVPPPPQVESCMGCHNGAQQRNDYSGPGLSNPHPFPPAANISCTGCHGGNPQGGGRAGSHVPAPPEIATDEILINDPIAYFNRLTLAGLDYLGNRGPNDSYDPAGHTNLDYIQFINPGDLRVVAAGRGCGANGCHGEEHGQWVNRSLIGTTSGIFSSTRFTVGVDNRIPEYRGPQFDGNTAGDTAPRAVQNPAYNGANREVGEVGRLVQAPEYANYANGPMRNNQGIYDANTLANHIYNANEDPQKPNRVKAGSPLEHLIDEQISITCGNCHLGNAGANNRYADFRSSGCTGCHMEYSYDGRSRSGDPNVNRQEPANADAIAAPERPHIEAHQIRNVAKFLPNGAFVRGISDRACVGCHQGSNRTVLQFWGIRLDQNQDVVNEFQYPANPADFVTAANDTRLYDPAVNNATFNGRVAEQHLLIEDYDDDGRDDTPEDVHYEAGMGCIDCHGSRDLHGGTKGDPSSGKILSREDQAVFIQCESCHGTVTNYAPYAQCVTYTGQTADCAMDTKQNALRHVTRDPNGDYWLVSRLDGQRHYIPQTKDTVVQNNKRHPLTQQLVYNPSASYAMGRADGNPQTGVGPMQADPNLYTQGFTHTDTMDCASCHASWTNNCIGCHLANQYNINPQEYFASNITGERIMLQEAAADFVYQTPVPFYLGVNSRGKITKVSPAEKMFYRYIDFAGNESAVFAFSDRLGEGNNANNAGRNAFPALSQNQLSAHSIRGKVTDTQEGPTYCVGCHMTVDGVNNFANEYAAFLDAYQNNDFANLDFDVLQQHIGQNPGNQLNSPIWVHMAAGLGSGLFLFDATGCPVNPLDANANRQYCPDGAPADNFDANNVVYDLDRLVEFNGVPNSSSAHPRKVLQGAQRVGASNSQMSGPLGAQTIQRLVDPNNNNPLVLDSWFDADGNGFGLAQDYD